MLSKIKAFFTGSDEDRTTRKDIEEQKDLAKRLCEVLSRAYGQDSTIRLVVEVGGYRGGMVLRGKEDLVEYMANWASAQMLLRCEELDNLEKGNSSANTGPWEPTGGTTLYDGDWP